MIQGSLAGWLTAAALSAVALPIIGAWLLTSDSPKQRAIGLALDRMGKIAVAAVVIVVGLAWLAG